MNHRVWCSNPAAFNDPWDGKPYFDLQSLDDPAVHAPTVDAMINLRKPGSAFDDIDRDMRSDPEYAKLSLHNYAKAFEPVAQLYWAFIA